MSVEERRVDELVRAEVRALPLYHLDLSPYRHKLDQNEVPWDFPRRLKERAAERLLARDWARYPDFHSDDLRRTLGRLHGHPWQGVLLGNGSNELLAVAIEAFCGGSGEAGGVPEILLHQPSFGLYPTLVRRAGARPVAVGPRADLAVPRDEIERAVAADPRRPVLLCTPNNPTGEAVPVAWVDDLLGRLEGPLLLDGAYAEFTRRDYLPLLARHPHLVVFRTFSKAWSLGGMRLGYLLGHPRLVAELIKVKPPYNLGHAGQVTAEVALEDLPAARRRIAAIVGRRTQWREMLEARNFEVLPSETNFLLVRCGSAARAARLFAGLAEQGILVRDVGRGPGLAGCLRISIGDGRSLRATARALDRILDEERSRDERPREEER